jgi:glycosyltransferase involved in cell wall biosynthesis
MRIAMVLSNPCAPDPRVEKEAAALVAAGHEVVIHAWDRTGGLPAVEHGSAFTIDRTGPRARFGGGLASIPRFLEFWRVATQRIIEAAPDVVHCHDTDTIVVGLRVLRALPRTRLVVDFHEMYRLSPMVPQRGPASLPARAMVDRLERAAVRRASAVIVASPGTAEHYASMGALSRLAVVMNVPEADLFTPDRPPAGDGSFAVCFVGRIRYKRTLVALMDAVARVPGTRATIAGDGPQAKAIGEAARGRPGVAVMGRVPYDTIPKMYSASDVVFAGYDAVVGNVVMSTPGKLFEAMACARAVIVSAGTWAGDFVERERVGIAVDCADPEAIAAVLRHLRDQPGETRAMGERGRALVEGEYNWGAASKVLTDTYARLANGREGSS